MELNREEFEQKLLDSLNGLRLLVDKCCFNVLSNNYTFILTEIDIHPRGDFHDWRLLSIELNTKKPHLSYDEVIAHLLPIYLNLHEITTVVYKAQKNSTIIEVAYVLKSALAPSTQEHRKDKEPTYHVHVFRPFYLKDESVKFDINWQHQEWKNWWKRLVWKWKKYKS